MRAVARTVQKPACALWRAAWRRISAPPPTRSKAPPNPASMSLSPPVPLHRAAKLNMTREQVLDAAVRSVRLARSLCADVEFSCEDATRTETDFLLEVCKAAVEAGATTINIPDTVGYATVDEYGGLIDAICREVAGERDIVISTHCHNDLGLATATHAGGHPPGRAAGGMHHQRPGRARGQRLAGRDRDGPAHPPGYLRPEGQPQHSRALPPEPPGRGPQRHGDSAQQGRGGRQRLRSPERHPSARRAARARHLRNHEARGAGHSAGRGGAGQAQRPSRAARACAGAGL